MKKHFKVIIIVISVLAVCGVGLWFVLSRTKDKPIQDVVNSFIENTDTSNLHARLETSQSLYSKHYTDTRLNSLRSVLVKLDDFEQDLNTYLTVCNIKPKTTKDLSKSYNELSSARASLIKECDEYIVRMQGNTLAEGQTVKSLYNSLFNKVASYISQYNSCFLNTTNFVFSSVTSSNNIKHQMYTLYSHGVKNLISNISNSQFKELKTITRLNSLITLDEYNNIQLKSSVVGGEFSILALNFKKYFNSSNKDALVSNFNIYYDSSNINVDTETSNEKLTVYYLKQITEV